MSPMVRRPPGIELALLGFLREGPMHGYQIFQMFSEPNSLKLVWELKQSQLYALLTKLELDGYLSSILQNQDPHPPRKIYKLTPAGRKACLEWLNSPVNVPRHIRQEFLAKLYFLQGDTYSRRALIGRQKSVCQGWLDGYMAQAGHLEPGSFGWGTCQYRISHIQAILAWLEVL